MVNSKSILKNLSYMALTLLLMIQCYGYDYQETFNVNTYDLPFSGISETYSFPYLENVTLYFNLSESDSRVLLEFPSEYHFNPLPNSSNVTGESFGLVINWTALDKVYATNESFNTSVKITNSFNSNEQTLGLLFNIIKSEKPALVINGTNQLKIINGSFVKEVTLDNLPDRGNLTFSLTGIPNEAFTINNCGEFLICPVNQFNFDNSGHINLKLSYSIPITTAIGKYSNSFNLITSSTNKTIPIIFYINTPRLIVQPIELDSKCTSDAPFDVLTDCYQKLQEHNLEIIIGYNRYMSQVNTEKICQDYKEKEYVVGDSISKLVLDTNIQLMDENERLRRINDDLRNNSLYLKEIINEKELMINRTQIACDSELLGQKTENQKEKIDIYKASEIDKSLFKEKYGSIFTWIAFIFMIVPLCFIGFSIMMRAKYSRRINLPFKTLSIISGFFGIVWLVLLIFV